MSTTFIEVHSIDLLKQYITEAVKEAIVNIRTPSADEKKDDSLLTKKEAAKFLGVSAPTLSKYIREGRVKALSVSGTRQRFWQSDLEKSIKAIRGYR
ncbi:MAG: excisionase family DNA-binding protein [Filimonas sp.]|nr:excisionase family DNA-binding protein [Filimonas sp.]